MKHYTDFEKLGANLAVYSGFLACAALLVMLVFIRLGGWMLCASCLGLVASLACMVIDEGQRDKIRREENRRNA